MLDFDIALWSIQHPDGSQTVGVFGDPSLEVWGLDREAIEEDLEIALSDRLERSHPSLLHRFVSPRGRVHERWRIPEGFQLLASDGPVKVDLPVDVIHEPAGVHRRVRLPAWSANLWVGPDDDLQQAVESFVNRVIERAGPVASLATYPPGTTELSTKTFAVVPAPLLAFMGENAGTLLLPEPAPVRTAEEKARDERVATPVLDSIGLEMTGPDARLTGALGRRKEVGDLLRMLEKPCAIVVIGPTLCGKSAIIEQVARELDARRGWYVNASRLVNASMMTGWRAQTLEVITELSASDGVWFVGDPLELLDAGKHVGSEMNVAQLVKPHLSSGGDLRILAECSQEAWGRLQAADQGFARLFTPYRLEEPADGRAIIHALVGELPLPVLPDAVNAAIELSSRYGPADAQTGTTAHFLRRLVAEARARGQTAPLERLDVLRRFCAETGMPELLVRDERVLDPAELRATFAEALIGQDEAIDLLVDVIAIVKGGMSDLERPLGTFLFVGPTGVGKTEAAKALSRWIFGNGRLDGPDRLIRFDMSEFSGPDCLNRLLDPSSGLCAEVRRRPFSVILLDEIEKAHPAVFDVLLQVLGEARLSDAAGQVADFRNTVVLLTSNLGVDSFRQPTGFGSDPSTALQQHIRTEVTRFFRPEFVNRIDRVVPFQSLGLAAIQRIAGREVDSVGRRAGLRGRNITLQVDDPAREHLASLGVDPAFGARPLKRAVTTHLVAPLARHLAGARGVQSVRVDRGAEGLLFTSRGGEEQRVDGRIATAVERVSELRYLAGTWLGSAMANTGSRETRLVDSLMLGKRFWADQSAAEARAAAIEPVRLALAELRHCEDEIIALEDLLHEAWLHRDAGPIASLEASLVDVSEQLERAVLGLAGCRSTHPDRITLVIDKPPAEDDKPGFFRDLVKIYAELALERSWTISCGGNTLPSTMSNLDRFVRSAVALKRVELDIEGPHAATLLADEAGVHVLKHPSTPVRIPVGTKRVGEELQVAATTRTLFDTGRSQLQDAHSRATTTLVNKWHLPLDRLLVLRLYVRLLGKDRGLLLWKVRDA